MGEMRAKGKKEKNESPFGSHLPMMSRHYGGNESQKKKRKKGL